ncbi:hypothetical protein A6411_18935 [Prescottella equi]|nr:hypothetical protein A6411_18935 [Prescottella equi]
MTLTRRMLIDVAVPLEAINKEAARVKSIRHGHPSTPHFWWARRPLAAARAVLFAQLVDDPALRPEAAAIADLDEREYWIRAERARLFRLIEDLVNWETTTDERLLKAAHEEILRSTDGHPPPIVAPFAGGGTIPPRSAASRARDARLRSETSPQSSSTKLDGFVDAVVRTVSENCRTIGFSRAKFEDGQ